MKKARLLVADDHEVVRQGLRELIARTPDLQLVGEASDGYAAELLARTQSADLMILDIALPERRGLQVLETLRADGIDLPILFFSMYPAAQYLDYARRAGAQGFVSKSARSEDLLHIVRQILAGRSGYTRAQRALPMPAVPNDPFATLSRRETEVMRGLLRGASLHDIAQEIGVGAKSVSTYRRRLLDKLGVKSNAELATLAARHGHP